jgi:hypothetical protein
MYMHHNDFLAARCQSILTSSQLSLHLALSLCMSLFWTISEIWSFIPRVINVGVPSAFSGSSSLLLPDTLCFAGATCFAPFVMSFQLNLSALTESARDHLSRLETSGASLRDRFRSPPPRSSVALPSSPHPGSAVGVTSDIGVGSSGESSVSARLSGGGCPCPFLV